MHPRMKVCYMCNRRTGPLYWLRRRLHPVPPTSPRTGLLVRGYSRCVGCARLPRPTTYWACGVGARRSRHFRHRSRWSMRLCQWLHGLDAQGCRKHGSDGL